MIYSFDEEVAKEVGVNCAVILDKFTWWIRQNEANERNFHDGKYWTFNSTKALTDMFPFYNARQIGHILKKLVDNGYLATGNYNKVPFDRTLWYTLTEKGERLMQNKQMHFTKMVNESLQKCEMRFDKNVKPIPVYTSKETLSNNNKSILSYDNITPSDEGEYPEKVAEENPNIEIKTNIGVNTNIEVETKKVTHSKLGKKKSGNYEGEIKEIVTYLNEKAKKNFRAATSTTQKHIKARLNEGFTVADCKKVIDTKVDDWLYDSKMNEYLRPQTLFGTKFESYLNSAVPKYDVDEVIRKQKERHDRELAEAMERMRQAEMEMKGTNETDTDPRSEGERKCGIRCSLQERRRSLGRNVDS